MDSASLGSVNATLLVLARTLRMFETRRRARLPYVLYSNARSTLPLYSMSVRTFPHVTKIYVQVLESATLML